MAHVYGQSGTEKILVQNCPPEIRCFDDIKPLCAKYKNDLEQVKKTFFEKLPNVIQKGKEKLEELKNNRNTIEVYWDEKINNIRKSLENNKWKPYLKRGGADQYYRPIMEALDWSEESIKIYDIPKNVPFEQEGIVISGVSSRLAARYMPKGCYWDSNKAIGFCIKEDFISIEYILGVLNSSLYNYLMKGIINNTNSIQITGIHALPFILPDKEIKEKVERLVKRIIENKEKNFYYDYKDEQKRIDDIIFVFYSTRFNLPMKFKKKLDENFSIYNLN